MVGFLKKQLADALEELVKQAAKETVTKRLLLEMLVEYGEFIGNFESDEAANKDAINDITSKENMRLLGNKICSSKGKTLEEELGCFFDTLDGQGIAGERKQLYIDSFSKFALELLQKRYPGIYQSYKLESVKSEIDRRLVYVESAVNQLRMRIVELNERIEKIVSASAESIIKRYDQTNKYRHFLVFSSGFQVDEVFVDGCCIRYLLDHRLKQYEVQSTTLAGITDIVENKRLLVIEGTYGSGKTMLSKRIQLNLYNQNEQTYYFDALDMMTPDGNDVFFALRQVNTKTVVFIDGVDKLVCVDSNCLELQNFCEILSRALHDNSMLSFVINTREYYNIGRNNTEAQSHISELLASVYLDELDAKEMDVVCTRGFEKNELFEEFFENINPDKDSGVNLCASLVKAWNKKSVQSCKLPLFAYAVGTEYYLNPETALKENMIAIYEQFVRNTINGRFKEESLLGTIDENLQENYELLLQRVSISMIHEMKDSINYSEDTLTEACDLRELYAISVDAFDEEVRKDVGDFYKNSKKKKEILSEVINNYFFSLFTIPGEKGLFVRFSDINIMCCFAASFILDKLNECLSAWRRNETYEAYKKLMNELRLVELQPQVMDLLWYKIRLWDRREREQLLAAILECLNIYENEQMVSLENVRALLVLGVMAIRLQEKSYKLSGNEHFFKMFNRLCMTAKALNINGVHKKDKHRYLAERYFMGCVFIDLYFKRLNYKYFNFTRSIVKNVTFLQCNFLENSFKDSCLENVTFELCKVKSSINETTFKGRIVFKNTELNGIQISDIICKEDVEIEFNQCTITNLIINVKSGKPHITFNESSLNSVKFSNCKKTIVVEVKHCVGTKIQIDESEKIYSDSEYFENFEKAVKPVKLLGKKEN